MAKDPAFLFYSSDFLTGTMTMTDEQVGKYIRLLCLQHQSGHLAKKDMLNICKTYDLDIFAKFQQDQDGNFFNKRLEDETIKRKLYSESRAKNRNSKGQKSTYVKHMENEIENEDININKDKIEKENKKPLVFPFSSDKFMGTWEALLKERKWRKKSQQALQASLHKLSKHSESDAIQMMINTIAGEWQGLFELKQKQYERKPTKQDGLSKLREAISNHRNERSGDSLF